MLFLRGSDAQGAQGGVGGIRDADAGVPGRKERTEGGCRDLLTRGKDRYAGWLGGDQFCAHAADGVLDRHRGGGGEERLAGWHDGHRVDGVGRGAHHGAWGAAVTFDGGRDGIGEPRDSLHGVGEGDDRDEDVAVGRLDRHTCEQEVLLDRVAVGAGAGQDEDELRGVDVRAVDDGEAWDLTQAVAGGPGRADGGAEQRLTVAGEQGAGGVDAGEDRACGAGGCGRFDSGVEARGVDALRIGQDDRGLAPGGQGLVGAGHHRR